MRQICFPKCNERTIKSSNKAFKLKTVTHRLARSFTFQILCGRSTAAHTDRQSLQACCCVLDVGTARNAQRAIARSVHYSVRVRAVLQLHVKYARRSATQGEGECLYTSTPSQTKLNTLHICCCSSHPQSFTIATLLLHKCWHLHSTYYAAVFLC